MAAGNPAAPYFPASAVPIAGSSAAPLAPSGASATSAGSPPPSAGARTANSNTTGTTPTRLSRGNSFRIPLPPNSPAVGIAGAISPSSPGASQSQPSQLATSYGSTTTTTSRLGNFALGFRRNRGASTNRGEIASPVAPPSPPAHAFPSLQPSTSLTDFGVPAYFDGGSSTTTNDSSSSHPALATSPSGHTPSASVGSASSTARGYFTRRGFGRKNTGGLLSGGAAGGRTPTSEHPPSLSSSTTAIQRSRSSSQPSLLLSVSSAQHQVANPSIPELPQQPSHPSSATIPASAMVFSGTSQPVVVSGNQTGATGGNTPNGGSSTDSSRRPSGEAVRAPATAAAPTATSTMHVRTASQAQTNTQNAPPTATSTSTSSSSSETQHIRLVPHLESTRSLHFDPVSRDILPTIPLRIGRFTDRNPNQPISALDQNRVAFKSKVVSRTHAEIWFEPAASSNANGNNGWFIRDLKSSSGTFLNHIRLSGAGMESRPFPIRDGDVLQLGVDYQGGTEEIYRCVKMRIELNRGWQRGANSFNTNALRQIRALGNVADQPHATTGEESKSKKKKHRKHKTKSGKNKDAALADQEGDEGTASDDMQVDKKVKEKKKSETPPSGVTDCCICLFSVTVYQALFIAPCSHIFHFKCIRPLLMQHHPGFSCPLCRTFGDLEADVEQDDVPEPVEEDSSSSSGESDGSEEEEDDEEMEGIPGSAPALPDKDASTLASASIPPANLGASSENTAVLHTNAIQLVSSDPNLDTLRPGRKSPLVPSASHFASSSSTNAQDGSRNPSSSARPSLDVARPASGTRTPPSRGSRVASFQSLPPSGAAVAAALEGHTTPNNQHHIHGHHSHHHSGGNNVTTGEGSFNPPSAGDFDPDIRRGSIFVHGADGHAMQIPITGRSRPGSVHEGDISTDAHQHHHPNASNTQSPSVSAAEKNKARSVRSMRMTKSKNSTNSLRNAAAAASAASPSGGASSAAATEHRRRGSAIASDEEDANMYGEEPLTATHGPSAHAHFDTGVEHSNSSRPQEDTHMSNEEQEQQDTTPPSSHQDYLESSSDVADLRGKGKESERHSGSVRRDINGGNGQLQDRQAGPAGNKQSLQDAAATSASVHAIV